MNKKKFLLRLEDHISEPLKNPIRSILFDRETKRYSLLNSNQTDKTLRAVKTLSTESRAIEADNPFKIMVPLTNLYGNTDIINLGTKRHDILSAPISAYLEISPVCNLHCIGCYQGDRSSNKDTLSTKEVLAFLSSFSKIGGMIVRLTGKEPTIHKDIVEIILAGKKLGLKMALNTNGVLSIDKIQKITAAGISEVVVSIDGDRKIHNYLRNTDTFDITIQSLEAFSNLGIDTRINMTVSQVNKNYIRFIANLAKKTGTYVSYIPIRQIGNAIEGSALSSEEMTKIAKDITKLRGELGIRLLTYFDIFSKQSDYYHPLFQIIPCHARKNIFVTSNGNVYPCDHLVDLGDIFCGGNIKNTNLSEIWTNGSGLEQYRNIKVNPRCSEKCEHFLRKCHGGCPSEAFFQEKWKKDNILEQDQLCPQLSTNK